MILPPPSRRAAPSSRSATKTTPFPLTPALSPAAGEREKRSPSFDMAGRIGFAKQLTMVLPLPRRGGEGWGEEANRARPTVAAVTRLSCPHATTLDFRLQTLDLVE